MVCININMVFKTIVQIFKRLSLPHVNPPLGRWNIQNYRETALKVKYANEDNCGVSSAQIQQNNESDKDYEYVYMMGFESVH
jgi:hypothetical protein